MIEALRSGTWVLLGQEQHWSLVDLYLEFHFFTYFFENFGINWIHLGAC